MYCYVQLSPNFFEGRQGHVNRLDCRNNVRQNDLIHNADLPILSPLLINHTLNMFKAHFLTVNYWLNTGGMRSKSPTSTLCSGIDIPALAT